MELFIMGTIVLISLLLGIGGGVVLATNIVKVKSPKAKQQGNGGEQGRRVYMAEDYEPYSVTPAGMENETPLVSAERPAILRALNDDQSSTEFNCLADGTDMINQINRQRERSNNSYNILSQKINAPRKTAPQDYGAEASRISNNAVMNHVNHVQMHNQPTNL